MTQLRRNLFSHEKPKKARALTKKRAQETLSTLAALHNSDLSAGGKDIIADFGDRQVNPSNGLQWNGKINGITTTAERIHPAARKHAFLNVRPI